MLTLETTQRTSAFRHAYTGLEAARIAVQLMRAIDDLGPDARYNDYDNDDFLLPLETDIAGLELACTALQEHVYADRLTVPDRVLITIREYKNRWPANIPGIEGASVALVLATRELDKAVDLLDNADEVFALVLGAWDVVRGKADLVASSIAVLDEKEVLRAIIAGAPLPEFFTEEDVAEARAEWAKRPGRRTVAAAV